MLDLWPRRPDIADLDDDARQRSARLVLTLGGVHRAVRLLLATELALERAQQRHTDGRPWITGDRGQERPLLHVTPSASDRRLAAIGRVAEAADALAADVAAEFDLPHSPRQLASQAEQEDAVARERADETAAWAAFTDPGALDRETHPEIDAS